MNQTFWLENPLSLFKDIKIMPKNDMDMEEKINCITRLVVIIFLIIYLFDYKYSFLFFLLSIIFIIILYYLQKNMRSIKENYSPIQYIKQSEKMYKEGIAQHKQNRYTIQKFPSYYSDERIESTEIVPDQTFVSINQKLVGRANPKTLVAPVIAPPSYDWTSWRSNDFIYPSMINEKRTQDYYGSGYIAETSSVENYEPSSYHKNTYDNQQVPLDYLGYYNGKYPKDVNNGTQLGTSNTVPKNFIEPEYKLNNYPGNINKICTYDKTNIDYNLPTNFMAGNCERNEKVKDLNNEVFTSTINPGIYYNTQIIEPLNYNIGISFDQQFPPISKQVDEQNNITFKAMDPSLYNKKREIDNNDYGTAPYEVYDPRLTGYGTSYRQYNHDLTGQTRFYYDDVDAVRRPNYITRTNIDHLLKADSYGIVQDNKDILSRNNDIRKIAEEGLLEDTLNFRTDMMTRLMRKKNAEMWQQRLAPIRKGANFTMTGGSCSVQRK